MVSGYVAILWKALYDKFECLATNNSRVAYEDYLNDSLALRFCYKGDYIPNMEVKFPKRGLDEWSIVNRKKVLLNRNTIYISPIELQIPFKLGTEKDFEDAQHLYELFNEKMDEHMFQGFLARLNVVDLFERELK